MSPVEMFVTRIKMESIDKRANHKIKVNSKLQIQRMNKEHMATN